MSTVLADPPRIGVSGRINIGEATGPRHDVLRINVGRHDERDVMVLSARVRQLEEAVAQMQARVFSLEVAPGTTVVVPASKIWTCVLKGFNVEYVGRSPDMGESKQKSYEACQRGENFASNCVWERIKCE